MPQQSVSKAFRYGFIYLCALVLLVLVSMIPPSRWLLIEIVKTISTWQTHLMSNYLNSPTLLYVFLYVVNFFFLGLLGIGGLIVMSCFPVIHLLRWLKPQWMPENTAYLTSLQVVNGWLDLILVAFLNILLAQALENLRII